MERDCALHVNRKRASPLLLEQASFTLDPKEFIAFDGCSAWERKRVSVRLLGIEAPLLEYAARRARCSAFACFRT